MIRIETTFELPFGIPCCVDVLGEEFPIIIGSNKGTLAFPLIPEDYKERFGFGPVDRKLKAPKNADMRLSFDKHVDWGYFSNSMGGSCVKKLRIWFYCSEKIEKR